MNRTIPGAAACALILMILLSAQALPAAPAAKPTVPAAAAATTPAPPPVAETGTTFQPTSGVTLWYEVRGSGTGTPLVIANGGPGFDHAYLHCSDAWDRLAKGRKVVYYDQRGNGRSGPIADDVPCGVAEQIDDLEALRAHLGVQKIDLLGHSWGGYLVMAYAARHPDRIAHLIIADSAAPRIQDTAFLFRQIYPETTARQDALAFDVELGDPEAVAADLRDYFTMIWVSPEVRAREMARMPGFVYTQKINKRVWQDATRFDLNPELPGFRMPTLVITGRYDFNVAPSVAWGIHLAVPGSQFAVFEKSGHLPFCEEPDAFVSRVESFLSGR
ncbi:MAG TPA: alpha/beta fold hydrolase [Candidatus Polarisedimenticolia bacterium]|nr:alpha/beta fold hydrolase [Candidatus Polarisedimenticolia bacterium]